MEFKFELYDRSLSKTIKCDRLLFWQKKLSPKFLVNFLSFFVEIDEIVKADKNDRLFLSFTFTVDGRVVGMPLADVEAPVSLH